MRLIVFFILAILISAGLYTAYGIMTFEPEKPTPLVFKEPDPQSLISLGILPADYNAKHMKTPLTPEQKQQASLAVSKISQAMVIYQDYAKKAPPRLRETLTILNGAIGSGLMPAYFLNVKDVLRPERNFDILKFDPTSVQEVSDSPVLSCDSKTSVLIGNDGANTINCPSTNSKGDQIFLGGPGDDVISDTLGDRIVNGGSGNDAITLGPGRSIIVLEGNWGHDHVTADCSGAAVAPSEIPTGFPVPWISKFTNFIVLSPRISKESVRWDGNVLTDTSTGDTLTVNENCFTLVNGK